MEAWDMLGGPREMAEPREFVGIQEPDATGAPAGRLAGADWTRETLLWVFPSSADAEALQGGRVTDSEDGPHEIEGWKKGHAELGCGGGGPHGPADNRSPGSSLQLSALPLVRRILRHHELWRI